MENKARPKKRELSRRRFIKTSGAAGAAALLWSTGRVFAVGSDKIRVGLIGCGGRGTHDTTKCLSSTENVELVAMGDLFEERLDRSLRRFKEKFPEKAKVTEDTCFVGWDAYKKVVALDDVDLVILTEPPHF
ncbi:MAG: twin-arginine translocation signal domain-containing protein, partial [Planctomycetes bacterium]|nr:twin-arginine translocation signal domain-containing protein [Planctomycetota bacterium]